MSDEPLDPEDAKLITLARGARGRADVTRRRRSSRRDQKCRRGDGEGRSDLPHLLVIGANPPERNDPG